MSRSVRPAAEPRKDASRYMLPSEALHQLMTRYRQGQVVPVELAKQVAVYYPVYDARSIPSDAKYARRLNKTTVRRQTTGGGRRVAAAQTPSGHAGNGDEVKDFLRRTPDLDYLVGWSNVGGRPPTTKPRSSRRARDRRAVQDLEARRSEWPVKRPAGVSARLWEIRRLVEVEHMSKAAVGRQFGLTGQRVGQLLRESA